MGSDAIANARVSAFNNKSANKKRVNKLANLKPNKVDVRSQHGLSQVNKREYNVKKNKAGGAHPPFIPKGREGSRTQGGNQAMSGRKHEHEIVLPITYNNEMASCKNSSVVRRSNRDKLSKNFYGNRISSCSVSCSSSCSEDDGCLDDWEAVADALIAENNRQTSDSEHHAVKFQGSEINCQYQGASRAWCPDDVYRPRSLPRVSKQQYKQNQLNSERCFSRGSVAFSWQSVVLQQQQPKQQQPSACPICCEDFDVTDSSFEPCPCGFRVCLFCHKKILEVDGRCPGCRKHYDSVETMGIYQF
ncbi:General negative regulator of transcription subunit 4 [Bienertia sinuspersici]